MKYEELKSLTKMERFEIQDRIDSVWRNANRDKLNTFLRLFQNYRCPVCRTGGTELKIINERHIYCPGCKHEYTSLDDRDSDFEFLGDGVIK